MLFKLTSRMVVTSPREVLFGPEQSCKSTSGRPLNGVFTVRVDQIYFSGFSMAITRQSTCSGGSAYWFSVDLSGILVEGFSGLPLARLEMGPITVSTK